MNDRSPVDLTQPDMLQKLDKYMKPLIRPFVYKWAITQVTNSKKKNPKQWLILSPSESLIQSGPVRCRSSP